MFQRVDHVGIAVRDLDAAIGFYERTFGVTLEHRETVEEQGVEEALFRVGESRIQLLRPLGPETPVGRFIERRGEGVHHVGYGVSDLKGALEQLEAAGVRLIDAEPRPGSRGTMVAFVHPKSAGGVLVELVQE